MERIELVKKVLRAHTNCAAVTVSFLEKPRKYTKDDDLYMREVHFVMEIHAMEMPTMGELAQRLNVTQGAVTQMAARLEKKGYVIRTKDTKDKRVTRVCLTEKGKKLSAEHVEFDKKEYADFSKNLSAFSDEELEKLIQYEQILCALFTKRI